MALKTATKPRKTAVQARSLATVDALLRATARILVKEGYDRASTNKIAALAGVSVGSLYQYFPSKEALVAALMRQHVEELAQLLRSSFPRLIGLPLGQAVRHVVRLMIEAHAVDPKLHRVLAEQVPRMGELARVEAITEEIMAMTLALLQHRRHELAVHDLELASFVVVSMVESLTHNAVILRPDLLGEPFECEVAAAVTRYLVGADRTREAAPTRETVRAREPDPR
jgi:AcrR family transcriptional regulator